MLQITLRGTTNKMADPSITFQHIVLVVFEFYEQIQWKRNGYNFK